MRSRFANLPCVGPTGRLRSLCTWHGSCAAEAPPCTQRSESSQHCHGMPGRSALTAWFGSNQVARATRTSRSAEPPRSLRQGHRPKSSRSHLSHRSRAAAHTAFSVSHSAHSGTRGPSGSDQVAAPTLNFGRSEPPRSLRHKCMSCAAEDNQTTQSPQAYPPQQHARRGSNQRDFTAFSVGWRGRRCPAELNGFCQRVSTGVPTGADEWLSSVAARSKRAREYTTRLIYSLTRTCALSVAVPRRSCGRKKVSKLWIARGQCTYRKKHGCRIAGPHLMHQPDGLDQ
jgi:hypothetical protein